MCGIAGRFERSGRRPDEDALRAATNTLRHRGPDGGAWWADGPFFLGHRRLAIIDLSDSGRQPMASADGRLVVTFNGEIYNYIELRDELRAAGFTFRTDSDTEVILAGYRAWGTDLPVHLVGMFAFGLVDRDAGTLFLARDRFGEKPLLVAETPDAVTFGSELKAIVALADVPRDVDDEALGSYLCLNYVAGERTLLRHVRRLAPGTWRLYGARERRDGVFWEPRRGAAPPTPEAALDGLQRALDEGVRVALRSDVPVTLFLSGGIDSSVVAESAVRQGKIGKAYCLEFPDTRYSEVPNATRVAQALGIGLERVPLTPDGLAHFLELVHHADDPLADSSGLAVWTLAREVGRSFKVAISGDGGDELFGGYLTYRASSIHGAYVRPWPLLLRRGAARLADAIRPGAGKVTIGYQLRRFLRAAALPTAEAHFSWNGTWMPDVAAGFAASPGAARAAREALTGLAARHALGSSPGLFDLQRADIGDYLPNDILAKVDRMTMAHGLEARAPLLTPAVAEFALSLPDDLKVQARGQPKRLLRDLATRLYGPEIGAAKKQGFSIPIHDWLRGPARELTRDLLSDASVRRSGLLNPTAVTAAVEAHFAGRDQLGFELWGLMVLVAWARTMAASTPLTAADPLPRLTFDRVAMASANP